MALDMGHLLLFRERARLGNHKLKNIFVRWHIAANTIEKLDWARAVQCETNIFDHLSVTHFDHDKRTGGLDQPLEIRNWKWIQRDGPQQADLESHGASLGGNGLQDAADNAVADQHDLGVFCAAVLGACFSSLSHPV